MSLPIHSPRPIGDVDDGGDDEAVRRVVGADRTLRFQIVQLLGIAGTEAGSDKRICASRRIVDGFGKSIVAFKADVLARPLLETHLQRIVVGAGREQREAAERSIKLRVRTQEIDQWNLVVIVDGFRFIKDGIGSLEKWQERIGDQATQGVRGRNAICRIWFAGRHRTMGTPALARDDLVANRRRQEIAIGRARVRTVAEDACCGWQSNPRQWSLPRETDAAHPGSTDRFPRCAPLVVPRLLLLGIPTARDRRICLLAVGHSRPETDCRESRTASENCLSKTGWDVNCRTLCR